MALLGVTKPTKAMIIAYCGIVLWTYNFATQIATQVYTD